MIEPRKRKIQLPSGKIIEIFDSTVPTGSFKSKEELEHTQKGLHVCLNCDGTQMCPVEWDEYDKDHWKILSRCPDCYMWRTEIAHQSACDTWDERLNDAEEAIRRDWRRLVTANMSEEIERFIAALAADHIIPEDF